MGPQLNIQLTASLYTSKNKRPSHIWFPPYFYLDLNKSKYSKLDLNILTNERLSYTLHSQKKQKTTVLIIWIDILF